MAEIATTLARAPRYRFTLPRTIGAFHCAPSPSGPYQRVHTDLDDDAIGALTSTEGRFIAEYYVVPVIGRRT